VFVASSGFGGGAGGGGAGGGGADDSDTDDSDTDDGSDGAPSYRCFELPPEDEADDAPRAGAGTAAADDGDAAARRRRAGDRDRVVAVREIARHNDVGLRLWDAGRFLADYVTHAAPALVAGRHVLEVSFHSIPCHYRLHCIALRLHCFALLFALRTTNGAGRHALGMGVERRRATPGHVRRRATPFAAQRDAAAAACSSSAPAAASSGSPRPPRALRRRRARRQRRRRARGRRATTGGARAAPAARGRRACS